MAAKAGQDTLRPGRKLSANHLALNLKPDEQEEHCHECVVDPVQDAQPRNTGLQNTQVDRSRRRVRYEQSLSLIHI